MVFDTFLAALKGIIFFLFVSKFVQTLTQFQNKLLFKNSLLKFK
jgi:hypothetical protein